MSRMKIAESPRYRAEAVKGFVKLANEMKAKGVESIDGGFILTTPFPCVDHLVVMAPRTRAQRKAMKKAAAQGHFSGFIYPTE